VTEDDIRESYAALGRIAEIHDYLDTERLAETWPA
jgi:hypothetical protein